MSDVPPSLDASLLLQHAEGLRTLVRRLVLDDHRVDDVLQDTWLRALQTPPRHPGAWGSWLRTVATRLAIRSRRRDTDRPRRESAAVAEQGAPGSAPSPAEIVERENARRKVVDAVMTLKEPYRDAILLRFFENLSAQDIATRLQLPLETVRTRVKRATTQLRERLDATHDGEPQRWHAALLPLFTLPIATVAKTTAATAGVSIAWKLWALRAAIALLVLLGGLTIYAGLQYGTDDAAIPAVTFTTAELEPVETWDDSVGLEPTTSDTIARAMLGEDESRPTLVVEGRVVDADARPLAEADVTLFLRARWPTPQRVVAGGGFAARHERVGRSVQTTADGRFRFVGPAHEETVLLVTARHAALAPAAVADAWHHEEGTLHLADLVLHAGHRIVGNVVTHAGLPLPGARVVCRPDSPRNPSARSLAELIGAAITNARGEFVIDGVPEGTFVLGVTADAHLPLATGPLSVATEPITDVGRIVLPATALLHGEVRDLDGQAVAGASVEAWVAKDDAPRRWRGRPQEPEARTDADGRFVLKTPPDRPLLLRIAHDEFATVEHGPLSADTTWTEVRLVPRASLAVLVVDAVSGSPIEDYAVRVLPARGNQRSILAPAGEAQHHAAGNSVIAGLQPGDYRVSVKAAGYIGQTSQPVATGSGNAPVVVRLERALELRGRVDDANTGLPVAGALVEVGANPDTSTRFQPLDLQRTDADGHFTSTALGAGVTAVRVSTGRHAPQFVSVSLPRGGDDLVVRMTAGATVSGRITDHRRGRRGMVVFEDQSGMRQTAPLQPATGSYTVEHLAPGTHRVHVELAGAPSPGSDSSRELTITAPVHQRFDFAAVDPLAATLRIRLIGDADNLALSAVLQAERLEPEHRRGSVHAIRNGTCAFENIAPGHYVLKILRRSDPEPGGIVIHEQKLELAPGAAFDLDVTIAAPQTNDHR